MREWLVIDDARKNTVFAPKGSEKPKGYIPRDAAEHLLGRPLGGTVWFTKEEGEQMRGHPEWRDTEPPHAIDAREIAEARALIGLAIQRLVELNRDDEAGIKLVLANARDLLAQDGETLESGK